MELGLIFATSAIHLAAAAMAFRLYRRTRELRFAIVTFALTVSALFPSFVMLRPRQGLMVDWLPNAAGGMAVLLTAVILVRTLTELTQALENVRHARDVLEQRVEERTIELRQANASLEGEIQERKRAEAAVRRNEAALQRNQLELQCLAGKLIVAQEEERRRLARELHDHLSQSLAALALELANVQRGSEGASSKLVTGLRRIEGSVHQLADDIHDMSRLLHPSILDDLGLEAAVRADCARFSDREGIVVHVHARNVPAQLPSDVALSLYRITQESLRNIAKHADVTAASVSIEGGDGVLRLVVEDSGCGFEVERARNHSGLGLISMSERVRLLEGTLEIHSQPGKGARIEVTAPVERKAYEQTESLVG